MLKDENKTDEFRSANQFDQLDQHFAYEMALLRVPRSRKLEITNHCLRTVRLKSLDGINYDEYWEEV